MKHEFHVIIERDEEGWLAGSAEARPGCHTQARSLDELTVRMQEAIAAYWDVHGDDIVINEFPGVPKITVDA